MVGLRRARGFAGDSGSRAGRAFGGTWAIGAGGQSGAASAQSRAASGMVLRPSRLWRDHQRYRRALDRSVSGARGRGGGRDRIQHDRGVRHANRKGSRISPKSHCARRRCAAIAASTGSRPMGCRPGATGGCFWSAPKARWSCAKTSTSRGASGSNHMFVAGRERTRYVDCSALAGHLLSRRRGRRDARGISRHCPRSQVFTVCRMALQAQANAKRYVAERRP